MNSILWRTVRAQPAAAAIALTFAFLPGALSASAEDPSRVDAKTGRPTGDRMSAALRLLVRTARDPRPVGGAISGARVGGEWSFGPTEALARKFDVRQGPEGPVATFRAILAEGSDDELRELAAAGASIRGHMGTVATFDAPLELAGRLAGLSGVRYLDLGRRLAPELDVSVPATGGDFVADGLTGYGATGAGVLVGVIDTGQDVKHMDFRRADKSTRFRSVWNMDPSCKGTPPPGHTGGCYYQEDWINLHLRGKKGLKYKDKGTGGGHGTHVAGIAAGNGRATRKGYPAGVYVGMAPEVDLVGVKVFDDDGYFVGDITEALQFLGEEQARLGDPPLVVNMSLGQQIGAHDGSDPDEIAIDTFVQDGISASTPRIVVKSAGNDGGTGLYRTASLDTLSSNEITVPLFYPGTSNLCGSYAGRGNDYAIASVWYPGDNEVEITVRSPGGTHAFSNQTGNDPLLSYADTPAGTLFVDCPPVLNPGNGDRECIAGVDDTGGEPPAAGTWSIEVSRVSGPSGGKFDAWIIEGFVGDCSVAWDSPSPGGTITIPGTAKEVIAVGAWVTKTVWTDVRGDQRQYLSSLGAVAGDLGFFSSEGPTRDGRIKPDLTAPGMGIVSSMARWVPVPAVKARVVQDKKHWLLEGTSMAAPHVTGAVALLFELDPALDAPGLLSLLTGSAATDVFTGGGLPDNRWGAGKLDVHGAAEDHLGPP